MGYKIFLIAFLCSCQALAMEPEEKPSQLQHISLDDSTTEEEDENPLGYDRAIRREFIEFRKKNFQKEVDKEYEIEIELLDKTTIIKKIPCPFYTPILFKEQNVGDKLLRFIQAYPTDRELAAMYARWLEKSRLGVNPYVIDWMARAVLITYGDETDMGHFFLYKYTHEYVDKLNEIQWQKFDLTARLKNISNFCHQKEEFARINKIKFQNRRQYHLAIDKIFIDECGDVLSFLSSKPEELSQICSYKSENPSAWFDAFFIFLISKLNQSGNGHILKKLSQFLYNKEEKTDNPPFLKRAYAHHPSLKLTYANHYLKPEKKYEEACSLYQSVLGVDEKGHEFFHTAEYYNKLIGFLCCLEQYDEAIQTAKKALILNEALTNRWNVAFCNILLGCFDDDVLKGLKRIVEMSPEERKKHEISHKITIFSYSYALYAAGKTEEFTEFILSQQKAALEKAFEREKNKGAFVKSGIAAQQLQQKKKRKQEKKQAAAKQLSNVSKVRTVSTTSTTTTTNTTTWDNASYSTEKYVAPVEKVKKKTRGTPYEQKTNGQIEQKEPEKFVHFKFIMDLTSNKHAWKTFNKLFEVYPKKSLEDPICFKNVTILLTDMNWLLRALAKGKDADATPDSVKEKKTKTGIDASRGKGAHKVATVDLSDEMGKAVITLTNKAEVTEYNIERFRNAFIKAGVFPDNPDIIEQLKAMKREMDLEK